MLKKRTLRIMIVVCVILQSLTVVADGGRMESLSEKQKQSLLKTARSVLDGNKGVELSDETFYHGQNFILTLFNARGEIVARAKSAAQPNQKFSQVLMDTLGELIKRKIKFLGNVYKTPFSKAAEKNQNAKLGDVSVYDDFLHFEWEVYKADLPNFGIKGLFDNRVYEPHMTGLSYKLKDKAIEITPLETIKLNWGPQMVRNRLAKAVGIAPDAMPKTNDLKISIYETDHFGERFPDRNFVDYVRGRKFISADDVNLDLVKQRLKLAGNWYKNNFRNGEVTYMYHPYNDEENNQDRTVVRSTMALWAMNKLAIFLNDDELKKMGEEGIKHYLEDYFQMSQSIKTNKVLPRELPLANGYIVKNHWSSAGFIICAIAERGETAKYQKEIELLLNWMLTFENQDHTLWTEEAQNQYFMPGHFLLAVATLFEKTGEAKYKEIFDRIYGAYEEPLRGMMNLGNDLHAPYAPAWFTQPLAKMYHVTKDDRYLTMVLNINDRVKRWYVINSQFQIYPDYDGILAPKAGYFGNNSVTAAALESLADAAWLTKLSGDAVRYSEYVSVLRHTTAYLMRLQYIDDNLFWVKNKTRTRGGFATDLVNGDIWMDNVWHLTSAFLKIYDGELLPDGGL